MTPGGPADAAGQPVGPPVDFAGARPPEPVVLTGRTCRLEPLATRHAAELFASLSEGAGDEQWTYMSWEPCRSAAEVEHVIAGLVADPGFVPFALVTPDGRARGMLSYLRIEPAIGTIEIGAIMFGAGARRAAPATEAMRLLLGHAVETLGYRRVEWKCDALNAPSRRAALRLGFGFEGVWRNATLYKGRNRDTAWYALTDDDWAVLAPAYDAWLDDLDADGTQRRPLAAVVPGT